MKNMKLTKKKFYKGNLFLILLIIIGIVAVFSPVLVVNASTITDLIGFNNSVSSLVEQGGYVKVEPTGVCERKGMVQIRFAMYLYPGDYGYNQCHIQVPVIPVGGYPGKIDKEGSPINSNEYNLWVKSLPKVWRDNPFHNHFVYVDPSTSDESIMAIGIFYLNEAYKQWSQGYTPQITNMSIVKPNIDSNRISAVNTKVQHLKNIFLTRNNSLFVAK